MKSQAAAECLAGMVAGLAQDLLLHPLDTLRARLDSGSSGAGARAAAGPGRALVQEALSVTASDGIGGLYRGYRVVLVGSLPGNAVYFGAYRSSRRFLGSSTSGAVPTGVVDAGAGLVAQLAASLVFTPLDVVRQRLQVAPAGLSAIGAAQGACSHVGPKGLYRGFWASLLVWGPFSASYFATYEFLKAALRPDGGGGGAHHLLAGVSAGAVAATVTQPLDCARTRMQVGDVPRELGIRETLRSVYRAEGARALWRGAAARALCLAPGCGIGMCVFEAVLGSLSTLHAE